jgi:hypothetical protein
MSRTKTIVAAKTIAPRTISDACSSASDSSIR